MKWTKREGSHPEHPEWDLTARPLVLNLTEEEDIFSWSIWDRDAVAMIAEGVALKPVEKAQARCLAVANGILLQRVRDAWGIPGIGVSSDIDMDGSTSWRCNHPLRHGTRFLTSERPSETKALLAALEAAP